MKIENIAAVAELYDQRSRLLNGLSQMEYFRHADFRLYFEGGVSAQDQKDIKNRWGISEDVYRQVNGNIAHVLRAALMSELETANKELISLGVEL